MSLPYKTTENESAMVPQRSEIVLEDDTPHTEMAAKAQPTYGRTPRFVSSPNYRLNHFNQCFYNPLLAVCTHGVEARLHERSISRTIFFNRFNRFHQS
jgi:hypothetical protein